MITIPFSIPWNSVLNLWASVCHLFFICSIKQNQKSARTKTRANEFSWKKQPQKKTTWKTINIFSHEFISIFFSNQNSLNHWMISLFLFDNKDNDNILVCWHRSPHTFLRGKDYLIFHAIFCCCWIFLEKVGNLQVVLLAPKHGLKIRSAANNRRMVFE